MSQLRKIKRKDLEVEKYSSAIEKALNYRIYAEHWYLDILTHAKWECWIWGDYEVIMPVPLQYKFGFKFVLQPIYCQQLGVFYEEEISDELFQEFEKKLHKYRVRAYHFNEENTERYRPEGERKVNYVLDLSRSYEEIKSSYSKSTKWNLKQFEKSKKEIFNRSIAEFDLIRFKSENSKFKFSPEKLMAILNGLEKRSQLQLKVLIEDKDVQAYGCFIISKNRVFYINSASNKYGKKIAAPTGILNHVIYDFFQQDKVFDFEGSSNSQIGFFFGGFGAVEKFYTLYSNSK